MKTSLDRIILLVTDFDEALAFYKENFDCHVIFDQKTKEGKRFLHIGFPQKYSAGIWFLKAETEEQRERVGNQTGGMPTFVLYTDNLEQQYQHLVRNKVEIVEYPVYDSDYKFLHFKDLYGNRVVLVELD